MNTESKEILFKPIIINGITTDYDISNYGGILKNRKTEFILKGAYDKDGYLIATLSTSFGRYSKSIHRLVAEAFIPNPENKPEVNHIDGNKTNNDVTNLEWVTRKENMYHAYKTGLTNPIGEANNSSIYTEAQIREACKLMEDPKNKPRDISRMTKISRATLYQIRKGNEWTHISKDYKFPEINFRFGSNNGNSRYYEDQIHKVCELLEKGKYPREISKLTMVSADIIQKIRKKEVWRQISDFYEFPDTNITQGENHSMAKYSNKQIHEVCRLLETTSDSYQKIANVTGVQKDTIYKIAKKGAWSGIAKDYDFSKRFK